MQHMLSCLWESPATLSACMQVSRQFYKYAGPILYESIWVDEHPSALEGMDLSYPGANKHRKLAGAETTNANLKLALLSNTQRIEWYPGGTRVRWLPTMKPVFPRAEYLEMTLIWESMELVTQRTLRHFPALKTVRIRMLDCQLNPHPIFEAVNVIDTLEHIVFVLEDAIWLGRPFQHRARLELELTDDSWPLQKVVYIFDPKSKINSGNKYGDKSILISLFTHLVSQSTNFAEDIIFVGLESLDLPVLRDMLVVDADAEGNYRSATDEEKNSEMREWLWDWVGSHIDDFDGDLDGLNDLFDRFTFLTVEQYDSLESGTGSDAEEL